LTSAIELWEKFATDNPHFGLTGTPWSWTNFRRTFEDELLESGACFRTTSRIWLAHRKKFESVVAALLLGQHVPFIDETKAAVRVGSKRIASVPS
jgi:hypothetical protein